MPEFETREAPLGSRTIEVSVRFFTDHLAEGRGWIRPKHGHTSGVVRMSANQAHGITSNDAHPFNSMGELSAVIEQVLIQHDVRLHTSDRMKKFIDAG